MNGGRVHHAILGAASFLAPGDQRAEWLREWRSELWYVPRPGATRFCLGAFRDAFWLRRNNPGAVKRTHLESPLRCLAFLAALAAVSLFLAAYLPAPKTMAASSHLNASDLPINCAPMLLLTCLLLPLTRLAMGRGPASRVPAPWPSRLRGAIFLALKIALVQPIMLGGVVVLVLAGRVAPPAPLGIVATWILTFRWVIADQRRRCPVCLRLLTDPVRIGTPSQTFLDWYGVESMCSRGHGLLQVPEISTSYSGSPQWHRLDGSWSSLFSQPAGARQ